MYCRLQCILSGMFYGSQEDCPTVFNWKNAILVATQTTYLKKVSVCKIAITLNFYVYK